MPYRDLLVQLDGSSACPPRVEAALDLAAAFDAHLTALHLIVELPAVVSASAYLSPDLRARMEADLQAEADAAVAAFRTAAEQRGVLFETRIERALAGADARVLSLHARYADLTVLGNLEPSDLRFVDDRVIGEVALTAGRPVLVIPEDGGHPASLRQPLVAWDGSAEAARALADAMPLLERAGTALIACANPALGPDGLGELPGADLGRHLARHGLEATIETIEAAPDEIGEALLELAGQRGSDLLVMGAYRHPRLRELLLGGVTHTILRAARLPVFLAH